MLSLDVFLWEMLVSLSAQPSAVSGSLFLEKEEAPRDRDLSLGEPANFTFVVKGLKGSDSEVVA